MPHPDFLPLTVDQFNDWMAFNRVHPFGPAMDNWRSGMLASVTYNINRGKKGKAMTADDFIPKPGLTKKQQVKSLRASLSHLVKKRGKN